MSSTSGGNKHVVIEDGAGNLAGFAPLHYDDIELIYTGSDLTSVVYRLNGGTVGTLTLTWTGTNLTRVVRT